MIFPHVAHFQEDADGTKITGVEGIQEAAHPHRPLPVPEQSPSARSLTSGSLEEEEAAVSSKDLGEWLRQHPTYTMDMPGFTPVKLCLQTAAQLTLNLNEIVLLLIIMSAFVFFSSLQKSEELLLSQFSKPKQKRHRCRNPNKIDINTLTGDERVPVVNRRNGRKVRTHLESHQQLQ